TGVDNDVDTCVAQVAKLNEFPKPAGEAAVQVTVTLAYHSGIVDESAPSKAQVAWIASLPAKLEAAKALRACYAKALAADAGAAGALFIALDVNDEGKVVVSGRSGFE